MTDDKITEKSEVHNKFINAFISLLSASFFWLKFGITSLCAGIYFRKKEKHGILLLRNDALGDFMVSIPLMMQIYDVAKSCGSSVTIVVSENMYDFACRCPFFDSVIAIPSRMEMGKFFTRIANLRKFAAIRAKTVINLLVFGRCGIEDYIVYLTEAQRKFTLDNRNTVLIYPGIIKFRNRTKFIYSEILEYDPRKTLQENEIFLASSAMQVKFSLLPGNLDFLRPLPEIPVSNIENFYLIVATSANSCRSWEPEKFAAIIDGVAEIRPDLRVIMTGSAGDIKIISEVIQHCAHNDMIVNLCGKTTLIQLIALADKAQFILSNETGPAHISALLHKKVFAVTGLGHWGIYMPNPLYDTVVCIHSECEDFRCGWSCRKKGASKVFPCIRDITVEAVLEEIKLFLAFLEHDEDQEKK